ncbi:FRG domain-containing protein [Streptomyces sp. NPDC056704]|uniref:FRG domain-containing protein n=1 Tax=Streptomyces sp. NPDC056704 TaxID=3345917 RepID=UPI0036880BD2
MTYEGAYRRYQSLVRNRPWYEVESIKELMRGDKWANGFFRGLPELDLDATREATALQAVTDETLSIKRSGEPFADAYQTGLYLHVQPVEFWSRDKTKLYRGQRNSDWPTTASLFRPGPIEGSVRRQRLASLAGTLAEEFNLDSRHAFAASQHYSAEAIVPGGIGAVSTWLLDITWNPFIALSFATHNGKEGDVGAIYMLWLSEWEGQVGEIAPLDTLTLDLTRPRQQEAGFVDSAFPELFDDHIPFRLHFKQKASLEFEDPELGASRANLYPSGDEVCDAVRTWAQKEAMFGYPPRPSIALTLPPKALRVTPNPVSSWVEPEVFLSICRACLHGPAHRDFESHIRRLAVFHSWARFLYPMIKARGFYFGMPSLHGLTYGAQVAESYAAKKAPPTLRELTSDYKLNPVILQSLVDWVEAQWASGDASQDSLWRGTADANSFLDYLGSVDP